MENKVFDVKKRRSKELTIYELLRLITSEASKRGVSVEELVDNAMHAFISDFEKKKSANT